MPVAQKFSTLGVYNGFPSCLPKIDVNEVHNGDPFFNDGDPVYVDWITLGGWSKDNGAPAIGEAASKSLSLQNASKLFYNLNGLTGVDDEGVGDVYPTVLDLAAGSFTELNKEGVPPIDLEGMTPAEKIALGVEPKDRVCGYLSAAQEGNFDYPLNAPRVEIGVVICEMYEGDVENELNFRGYGLYGLNNYESAFYLTGFGDFPDLDLMSLVKYQSYDPPSWITDKTIVSFEGRARAYGELNGIHFLGYFFVATDVSTISIEFIEGDDTLVPPTSGEVSGTFSVLGVGSITVKMKDFTFYTY